MVRPGVWIARSGVWKNMNDDEQPPTSADAPVVEGFTYGVTRPTESNTYVRALNVAPPGGVVAGASGQLTITVPGTYEDKDYTCYVTVNASAATAANPIIIRGNRFRGGNLGTGTARYLLRVVNSPEPGAVIVEQNLFDPDFEYDQLEGVRCGGNVIVRRNIIQHVIDGSTLLFGHNTLWGNLFREGRELPTTTQPDGKTHTDAIIVAGGDSDDVFGNDVSGWSNAAVFVKSGGASTYGPISNANIRKNWLWGPSGAILHVFKTAADAAVTCSITDNIFQTGITNQVYVASTVAATISGNKQADGTAANVIRFNAG